MKENDFLVLMVPRAWDLGLTAMGNVSGWETLSSPWCRMRPGAPEAKRGSKLASIPHLRPVTPLRDGERGLDRMPYSCEFDLLDVAFDNNGRRVRRRQVHDMR